jgi:hypothetical protein
MGACAGRGRRRVQRGPPPPPPAQADDIYVRGGGLQGGSEGVAGGQIGHFSAAGGRHLGAAQQHTLPHDGAH